MVINAPFEKSKPAFPSLPVLRIDFGENFFPTEDESKEIFSSSSKENECTSPSTEDIITVGTILAA